MRLDGRVVAEHQRSWGTALTLSDPEHVAAAARARQAFQAPRPTPTVVEVVQRDLADYDAAFGVEIEVAS